MKKLISILTVLLLLMPILCFSAPQPPSRYKWIESDKDRGIFFDTQTIKFVKGFVKGIYQVNTSIVDVWIYTSCNDGEINRIINFRRKNKIDTNGFESLLHYLTHYRFNLNSKQIMFLSATYYDNNGNIIETNNAQNPFWVDSIPGSAGEYWIEQIENYVNENWYLIKNRSEISEAHP